MKFGEKKFGYEHQQKLYKIDKEKCEGLLTEKECLEAVKLMEAGKSHGTDSLPTEFYKVCWKVMYPFLISSLNSGVLVAAKWSLILLQGRNGNP